MPREDELLTLRALAHDMRTPLGTIVLLAEAVLRHDPAPDVAKRMRGIVEAAGQLDRLVEKLRELGGDGPI